MSIKDKYKPEDSSTLKAGCQIDDEICMCGSGKPMKECHGAECECGSGKAKFKCCHQDDF